MKKLYVLMPLLFLFAIPQVQAQEVKNLPLQLKDDPLKDLSGFSRGGYDDSFKVDGYIRVAAQIQAMGEEKGSAYLLSLSRTSQRPYATIILARMLFVPLRAPWGGETHFLGETKAKDWTRQPFEIVDGVPFFIGAGGIKFDAPETPKHYVLYCIKNCAWSLTLFKPKSQQEKQEALEKLIASPKWKRPLKKYEKEFLADQIK